MPANDNRPVSPPPLLDAKELEEIIRRSGSIKEMLDAAVDAVRRRAELQKR